MIHYNIIRTQHNRREGQDFNLTRPDGSGNYLFLHFKTPVIFRLANGLPVSIKPGACIILSPETPHAFRSDGEDLLHDWVHFIPDSETAFLSTGVLLDKFFYPSDTAFITPLVKKCELELIYREEFYEELASAELNSLIIKLKRQLNATAFSPHSTNLKSLREAIYRNPGGFSGAEQMAEELGLSRTRFSVVYKEFFGISPNRDLIEARISMASHLLTVGTMNLTHIAEVCGYQSVYHFIRQFRNEKGITPGDYRKSI